ncbi:MAG: hypothetical protein HQ507_00250 [Candidatus Marinimicrobia bacterium]|nr:hypothetical protein [Candidatus Neomarinimicrobiota bacterium]
MADKKVTGNQGKRYSTEEKAEMFEFIRVFDTANKRGGMKAASEKYGVSVVTLSNWKKGSQGPKKRKTNPKVKTTITNKAIKTGPSFVKESVVSPDAILSRLQAIRVEINGLEKEFNELKKKL